MKSLSRNANNDMFATGGIIGTSTGALARSQIIEAIILTVKGELQLDTEDGVAYFDSIFLSPRFAQVWKAHVISRIMKIGFVDSVQSFEYDIDFTNHSIDYSIVVVTSDGTVKINGNVEQ